MKKAILKSGKAQSVRRFHPWVFSGAIDHFEEVLQDGDPVAVYDHKDQFLGAGHYQEGSIMIRLLTFEPVERFGKDFWNERIQQVVAYRRQTGIIGKEGTNCFRLVHAEGDMLPGLIVDVYGATAVLQCHSIGMHRQRQLIAAAVKEALPETIEAVYDKSESTLPKEYGKKVTNSYLIGESAPGPVQEHGHQFWVDWETGQKTGFFLDQRENRRLLQDYVKGKRVLNAFAYSGGFSVYALAAGAHHVTSVDLSEKAIQWAEKNIELNGFPEDRHEAVVANVMEFFKASETTYEVMVVDPPAFAKGLKKRHQAVQAYKRLNVAALRHIEPGGILFTFSCSQVVDKPLFYNTIVAAAIEAGRSVRVMHSLEQPPDHPVQIFHPESSYLKGLVLYVE
jgi:23S rRNA (cytosine1962-C5)-methyltransferase